jgi:hypothetical protein
MLIGTFVSVPPLQLNRPPAPVGLVPVVMENVPEERTIVPPASVRFLRLTLVLRSTVPESIAALMYEEMQQVG